MRFKPTIAGALALLCCQGAWAQAQPRIAALYPPGARAGTTVEVAIRGGGLEGARELLVTGKGLSATLNSLDIKIDPAEQKLFAAKCALCHDLRGPATISRTADQWVATLDRMIRDKAAPIEAADRTKIASYLTAAARSSAGLTARVSVAADATPGLREIRVVGANGTSSAFPFEVSTQPEALETEPNDVPAKAPSITLPVTVSGQIGSGDIDNFAFEAKQGQRIIFNCNAYRMNPGSQAFFFPVLYLYDAKGALLKKNSGYFSLDPLIDWTAPADGKYVIQVRDMLYRGSPSSVYRLSVGALPYGTYLFPAGGRKGETANVQVQGENMQPAPLPVPLASDAPSGVRQVATGYGAFPFVVGEFPEFVEGSGGAMSLPVSVNGRLMAKDEADKYPFTVAADKAGQYAFDSFVDQIGSQALIRITVRDGKGRSVGSVTAQPGNPDPRLDVTLAAGDYVLEIADAGGKTGPASVYRVSAGPAKPDFAVAVSPDTPNLGPGSSVYLGVRVLRRIGVPGEIELEFPNLPPGVTASAARIRPNQNQGFVILTAAPDAKVGSFTVLHPIAKAVVNGETVLREAASQEYYRINNNLMTTPRESMVVTIGPQQGWTLTLTPSAGEFGPGKGPVTVKIHLNRNGMQGDLPLALLGVPPGVNAPGSVLFRRGMDDMSITLTASNSGIFAEGRSGPARKQFFLALVNGREGEAMMMASPAVAIPLAAPAN